MQIAETILAPLRAAPIFRSLDETQINAIAGIAQRVLFKPGDTIMTADTAADSAILVAWGEATALSAGDVPSAAVPAGALLSEMAMFVEIDTGATVVARTAVRALRIRRADMLDVLADDPDMADRLVQCVAGRLRWFVDSLAEIEGEFSSALDISEIRHALNATGSNSASNSAGSAPH